MNLPRNKFLLIVVSILVFSWSIAVGISLGQHGADARPRSDGNHIKGVVIAADEKEVTVKADDDEGRVIVVKVPMQQLFNGKWVQDKDIAKFTAGLEPGEIVDVDYGPHGETYFIKFIKKAGEASGVFHRERNIVTGWVISSSENDVKIETTETDKEITLRVPRRRTDDGKWVKNADIARVAEKLPRGQLIMAKYRLTDAPGVFAILNIKRLYFANNEGRDRPHLMAQLELLEERLAQIQKIVKEILGRNRPYADQPYRDQPRD